MGANLLQEKQNIVRKVVHSMIDHPPNQINLTTISDELDISKYKVCRVFQIVIGTSPMKWFLIYRVFYAAELICSNPKEKISTISTQVGFKSVHHFARCFQEIFQQSAREYRRDRLNKIYSAKIKMETNPKKIAMVKTMNMLQRQTEFII